MGNNLGFSQINGQDIFGSQSRQETDNLVHTSSQEAAGVFGQSNLISQSAHAVQNAKLILQQSLQNGVDNNEVQNLATGYLKEDTLNLDKIFQHLSVLGREKAQFGKLSSKSIEDLKKVTDQLKYQKNKLSEKLLVAENNAQIKGNTLANLKESEQALASIENTLKSFSNSLGMSEKMEQQLFGQHILGQSNSQQGSTLFGQTTSQSDILSQSANEIKNAKLMP